MLRTKQEYMGRYTTMETIRKKGWDSHWKELQQYLLPRRSRFETTDTNDGKKKNSAIYDNTPTLALRTLASGMMAGLTSPARPWFRLTTPDPSLSENDEVKAWLSIVVDLIREVFSRSNVYQALQTIYEELGGFGTGVMVVLEDDETVIRCYPMTVGEYCLDQNERLQVDTLYRKFAMTTRQLVRQFGLDNCSENVQAEWEKKQYDVTHDVLHVIEPNEDVQEGRVGPEGKTFYSLYMEFGAGDEKFLRKGGYEELVVFGARWSVLGTDIYGRGPGMDALGDIKQLQSMTKVKGQAIQKQVNPPLVAPETLKRKRISSLPNGITYVDMSAGNAKIESMYNVNLNLRDFIEDLVDIRERVKRAMFEDLFLMMTSSTRRQITAREVEERHEEKMLMLGPVLERLKGEMLDPLIDRTFAVLLRKGFIPTPPEVLQGSDLKVELISMLAQAQKAVAVQGMDYLLDRVGVMAQSNPAVLDKIDFDQTVDEYAEALGVPPAMVLGDDVVGEQRDVRAQQEQAANAMAMTREAAAAAKDAGAVPTEGGGNLATDAIAGLVDAQGTV